MTATAVACAGTQGYSCSRPAPKQSPPRQTYLMHCTRKHLVTGSLAAAALALLAPAAGASSFEPVPAKPFKLRERGFVGGARLTSALEQRYPRVGLQAVLSDLDQATTPAGSGFPALAGVAGLSVAYSFSPTDAATPVWTPQGISGSADADPSGLFAGRRIHAVSWYRTGSTAVRISFVDVASGRYRNVLLVAPKSAGTRFDQVPVHAGGIAWLGKYLYVADTNNGFRVFDTERIVRVPAELAAESPEHPYLMPQVGRVESVGARLTFSSVSFDRGALPAGISGPGQSALVVGEYRTRTAVDAGSKGRHPARVVRFPVNSLTGRLASPRIAASQAYVARGLYNLQGSATIQGLVVGSSSAGPTGRLYTGRPGGAVAERPWGAFPEDLYVEATTGSLLSVTEMPLEIRALPPSARNGRAVFGVPVAALGLGAQPSVQVARWSGGPPAGTRPKLLGIGAKGAIRDITWRSWDGSTAKGNGVYEIAGFAGRPGTGYKGPVDLTFSGKHTCGASVIYTTLTLHLIKPDAGKSRKRLSHFTECGSD